MSSRLVFSLDAPAKLNLGLEILGKRRDGFHELVTIFLAVDLFDTLDFATLPALLVDCSIPDLSGSSNLVLDAMREAQKLAYTNEGARITLHKRIPVAAGLGGASSDAATTLIGCQRLWDTKFSIKQLHEAATGLGSDVPFLLVGGCALGRGRGERLAPLPLPVEYWFVVVSPRITIQNKTATLFGDLQTNDFTKGDRILRQAESLESSGMLDSALLDNAFTRAIYDRVPSLKALPTTMRAAGASCVALSGAGPTHYSIERDPVRANHIAVRLREVLGATAQIDVVQPLPPRSPHEVETVTARSASSPR